MRLPSIRSPWALLCLLAAASPLHAADYWVKNGGSNAADGLSVASAWATLPYAAGQVGPGDTVHVMDGNYQGFHQTTSGTPGNPITWKAEGSSVAITSNNPTTPDGINLEGASHVVIDGFIADNRTRAGIRAVEGSHVTVRNCRTGYNGVWGIFTGHVDDFTAEFNETHHSFDEHGIYVSNACDRPIVRNNWSHDNNGNGLHFNGDASFGGDGIIEDALVENNLITGNGAGGGSGINMDGASDGVIRNNLLYDNHASGISLYRIDAAAGSRNNLVINNTIVQASDGRWAININNGSTGNTLRNNILYNLHSFRGVIAIDSSSRTGFSSDYNSLMNRMSLNAGSTVVTLTAWQAQGYDTNSFLATPADHFVAPGSDYHLKADSPAIDAGTATNAPPADFDGAPRPVGAGVDVGAYEVQSLECGDGGIDPGEQCGEPGLSCTDPCTTCAGCSCVPTTPVCGDALVCGVEQCESDGDCGGGLVCQGCQCVNPSPCTSGIVLRKPKQSLRASTGTLSVKAEAVIPKPWSAVNPPANGLRVLIDGVGGAGGVDVVLPGGAAWTVNGAGNKWTYRDPAGAVAGVTKVVVQDRSNKEDGLLKLTLKGKGGSLVLPAPADVRTTVVLGAASECAQIVWNGPGQARPRCDGDASRLTCK